MTQHEQRGVGRSYCVFVVESGHGCGSGGLSLEIGLASSFVKSNGMRMTWLEIRTGSLMLGDEKDELRRDYAGLRHEWWVATGTQARERRRVRATSHGGHEDEMVGHVMRALSAVLRNAPAVVRSSLGRE